MIILDVDGVLADFTEAACKVHGHSGFRSTKWDFFLDWDISETEFWGKIHALGNSFYEDLVQPYPWLAELMTRIDTADDWVLMTATGNNPACYSGKKIWVDKYIQPLFQKEVKLIMGHEKHLLAGPNRLLIDDNETNVSKFLSAGGYSILFAQPWNSADTPHGIFLTKLYNNLAAWSAITKKEI